MQRLSTLPTCINERNRNSMVVRTHQQTIMGYRHIYIISIRCDCTCFMCTHLIPYLT